MSSSNNYSLYDFVMHDYITVSPVQYFVHLNSCVVRNLATSMTFDPPPKRPVHLGKTILIFQLNFFIWSECSL